jgi:DNA-binding MarR family transcriptional regulator
MDAGGAIRDAVAGDLATIYRRLQELTMPVWLRLDLSMAQFRALVVIGHHPGMTVGELGTKLAIGQSASSFLSDAVVRRGLVGRTEDPADRRRALLSCTPAGEAQLAELRQGNQQALKEWLRTLDEDRLRAMADGLAAVAEAARQSEASERKASETTR